MPPQIPNRVHLRATTPSDVEFRGSNGNKLTKAERDEIFAALDNGERPRLDVGIRAYSQTTTPRPLPASKRSEANANFFIFAAGDMKRLARSFKRQPFLLDHDESISSKMGRITDSQLDETAGELVISQSLEVTKPQAVEGLLDGTIEGFSIGASPRRDGRKVAANCSVCGQSYLFSDCPHIAGRVVDLDDGGGSVIVEVVLHGFEGRETSGVVFPAVAGTEVQDVSQLSESADFTQLKEQLLMAKTQTQTTDAITHEAPAGAADLAEARARVEELELELAAEKESKAELSEQVKGLQARFDELDQQKTDAAIDALHQRALNGEGFGGALFKSGDKREEFFLAQCKKSIAEGEAYLATLEPSVVGASMQSTEGGGERVSDDTDERLVARLSAKQKRRAKAAGIPLVEYARSIFRVDEETDEGEDE